MNAVARVDSVVDGDGVRRWIVSVGRLEAPCLLLAGLDSRAEALVSAFLWADKVEVIEAPLKPKREAAA